MKIGLQIKGMGHVPAFKNKKRTIKLKNGGTMPVTDRKTKDWMQRCTESFAYQLSSGLATTEAGILMGASQQSLIASSMPLDDSRQWIPEIHIYSCDVDAGNEGASIVIEKITTPNGSESNQTKET